MEPVVDRIKNKYFGRLKEFKILNVRTKEGRGKVILFSVTKLPTFLVFDDEGKELDRVNGDIEEQKLELFIEHNVKMR